MIKGRRVYLADLVEEYPGERPFRKYATFHTNKIMFGPFTVLAAGKRSIVVENEGGKISRHFCEDCGLIPYVGTKWNPSNATFEMLDEPVWQDDWM